MRVSSDQLALAVARTDSIMGPMVVHISDHACLPERPSTAGCLAGPRKELYASLYSSVMVGPHQTCMGNRDMRQMRTAMRRFWGQASGGPRSLVDQSKARMRAASSLSPGKMRERGSPLERLRVIIEGLLPRSIGAVKAE